MRRNAAPLPLGSAKRSRRAAGEELLLPQILLHWIVALLVLAQILNDDAIGRAFRALRRDPAAVPDALAQAHVWIGVTILLLVVWRLGLRFTRGAPPPPADEPAVSASSPSRPTSSSTASSSPCTLSGIAAWFGGIRPPPSCTRR